MSSFFCWLHVWSMKHAGAAWSTFNVPTRWPRYDRCLLYGHNDLQLAKPYFFPILLQTLSFILFIIQVFALHPWQTSAHSRFVAMSPMTCGFWPVPISCGMLPCSSTQALRHHRLLTLWLERQDLPCTYLAHHEPESIIIVVIVASCSLLLSLQPSPQEGWSVHSTQTQVSLLHTCGVLMTRNNRQQVLQHATRNDKAAEVRMVVVCSMQS